MGRASDAEVGGLKTWLATGDTEERRKEFIGRAFDRYDRVTGAAVRNHDPNHLNLGMRGGGRPTDAEIRAARAFDVYSRGVEDKTPAAAPGPHRLPRAVLGASRVGLAVGGFETRP